MARKFAGFDLLTADSLRKCIGKKLPEEIKEYKEKFINGCLGNGYQKELAEELWSWLEAAAGYSFNLSHSISYAMLAYVTAYLKHYHTNKFFEIMLQLSRNKQKPQEEISQLFYDSKLFDVEIKQPNIKNDNIDFQLEGSTIYYGLSHIKHVGKATMEKIMRVGLREWDDVIGNIQAIKIDALYSLILSGAFDCFGKTRLEMKSEIDLLNFLTPKERLIYDHIRFGLKYTVSLKKETREFQFAKTKTLTQKIAQLRDFIIAHNERLKFFNKNRAKVILDFIEPLGDIKPDKEFGIKEKGAYETHYLGVPVTCCEVDIYDHYDKSHDLMEVKKEIDNKVIGTIGIVNKINARKDRNSNQMAFVNIYDGTYSLDIIFFHDSFAKYGKLLQAGRIFLFKGIKRRGSLIVNMVELL
jgi:DNA polymerase III alpha subunit